MNVAEAYAKVLIFLPFHTYSYPNYFLTGTLTENSAAKARETLLLEILLTEIATACSLFPVCRLWP